MYFLHPIFALSLIFLAVICVRATFIWVKGNEITARFGTIDGLRGYLAFFVFIHHAAVWFTYTRTNIWVAPDSKIYTHLGQSSVALFFMITSFLFYNKLLNSKKGKFSWKSFFIGRIFRLTPLYLFVILTMFFVVALLSDWTLFDKPRYVLFCSARWLLFTVPGAPNINHIEATRILAGVTWSLPYEWCFYLVLPFIALTAGQRPPWMALAVAVVGLAIAWYTEMQPRLAMSFIGGIIAARALRYPQLIVFAKKTRGSVLASACFAALLLFPTAYEAVPLILLTIGFCLIAAGTDLFGLLLTQTSRRLGELAYSIYLVHGILLFTMINFIIGRSNIAVMPSVAYWLLIAALVPVVLGLSTLTFRLIEQPGINMGDILRARWSKAPAVPERFADSIGKTLN